LNLKNFLTEKGLAVDCMIQDRYLIQSQVIINDSQNGYYNYTFANLSTNCLENRDFTHKLIFTVKQNESFLVMDFINDEDLHSFAIAQQKSGALLDPPSSTPVSSDPL